MYSVKQEVKSAEKPAAMRATRLCKSFSHVRALREASITVQRGHVVALLGDNGAGKSTLAKCLCGAHQPDSGSIEVDGVSATLDSIKEAQRLGITAVYQDLSLAGDLSVTDNVFLGYEVRKSGWRKRLGVLDREEMAAQTDEALRGLGIVLPTVWCPVGVLSGGQRQAVAVAKAVMWSASYIVMDEPTAALGTRQADIVCDVIRSAAARHLGVLVIAHDIPRMLEVADWVVVMRQGRVVLSTVNRGLSLRDVVDAMVGHHESEKELSS
jgi:simple sugar transport system ATP-binding protein